MRGRSLPRLAARGRSSPAIAILPVYLPYRRAAREQHMVRTLDVVKDYSATPRGYLATAGRVHFSTWSGRFFKDPVDSFFPGFVDARARARGHRRRASGAGGGRRSARARASMMLAGDRRGGRRPLARHRDAGLRLAVRGLSADAGPARRGALRQPVPARASPCSAGLGLARVEPRSRWLAIALLIVLVNVESLRAPFTYQPFDGIPGIYRAAARRTRAGRRSRSSRSSRAGRSSRTRPTCWRRRRTGGR